MLRTSRALAIGKLSDPETTSRCIGCSRNSNPVTTPKLPLPPRTPQKRSGFSAALAWRSCPSAVTMSTDSRLSIDIPNRRASRPKPPPNVRPPTPVCDTVPSGVTNPCAMVSLSTWPSSVPPATFTRRAPRIHANSAEVRQVDLHAAIARRLTGVAVTAALHRDQQIVGACKVHRRLDVRRVGGAAR